MTKDKNKLKIKKGRWEREILAVKVAYTASDVVYASMINKF